MGDYFSPAQVVGYGAFVLGVASFLQKSDRQFKIFMTLECLAYAIHFSLLGFPPAVASSIMSTLRSAISLKTRALWVALVFVAINIVLGILLVDTLWKALPLLASCIGTMALYRLDGIRMRLAMLCGTLIWLTNNYLSGSYGGTALEAIIAVVNIRTILQMQAAERALAEAK